MSLWPGLWFVDNDGGPDWGTVRWSIREVGPEGTIVSAKPVLEDVDYDFGNRIAEEHNAVRAFIRDRQQYVEAAKQQRGHEAMGDYLRWQGHMESRRQLAQKLNLPYEFGPRSKFTENKHD